jgi:ATP-binding cassette subfamily B protein
VGPSGAGKTTLFDLLQRFYDPDNGMILVGGTDIRDLQLENVRGSFGFVPQNPTLFSGTLRDNLKYAKSSASDAEINEALDAANASQFVKALTEGLDTRVGEDGIGLSGGQLQRVAIARAMLLKPKFLLLDEATSALDAQSEQFIRQSIESLKGEMTILVIAHRLSTVRQADRILVFDAGFLIASGRHEELLEANALYASFADIQFSS